MRSEIRVYKSSSALCCDHVYKPSNGAGSSSCVFRQSACGKSSVWHMKRRVAHFQVLKKIFYSPARVNTKRNTLTDYLGRGVENGGGGGGWGGGEATVSCLWLASLWKADCRTNTERPLNLHPATRAAPTTNWHTYFATVAVIESVYVCVLILFRVCENSALSHTCDVRGETDVLNRRFLGFPPLLYPLFYILLSFFFLFFFPLSLLVRS